MSSSTFRLTISAILREPLNLRLQDPGKLEPEEKRRVSQWFESHLRVAIVPWEDRDSLEYIEQGVLDVLDPPSILTGGLRPRSVCTSWIFAVRSRSDPKGCACPARA